MFVLHVALQGCLRGSDVHYGLTADTGGHIRYILDLATRQPASSGDRPDRDRDARLSRSASTRMLRSAVRERQRHAPDRKAEKHVGRLSSQGTALREHDSLVEALVAHIRTLDRAPDLVHAHYADAGLVAARVSARLNIPYVFTAHRSAGSSGRRLDGIVRRPKDLSAVSRSRKRRSRAHPRSSRPRATRRRFNMQITPTPIPAASAS